MTGGCPSSYAVSSGSERPNGHSSHRLGTRRGAGAPDAACAAGAGAGGEGAHGLRGAAVPGPGARGLRGRSGAPGGAVAATPVERQVKPPVNLAHILHNMGWHDAAQLGGLVAAWRSLFELLKPDVVVFDH